MYDLTPSRCALVRRRRTRAYRFWPHVRWSQSFSIVSGRARRKLIGQLTDDATNELFGAFNGDRRDRVFARKLIEFDLMPMRDQHLA